MHFHEKSDITPHAYSEFGEYLIKIKKKSVLPADSSQLLYGGDIEHAKPI